MESNNWSKIFEVRECVDRVITNFLKAKNIKKAYLPTISKSVTPEHYTDSFCVTTEVSSEKYYLQPSPEFYLKKLIADTSESYYYLGPVYRAGENIQTTVHVPEFTMLEWYKIGCPFRDFENMTIDIITEVIKEIKALGYFQEEIPKVNRVSWKELFAKVNVELSDIRNAVSTNAQSSIRDYLDETDDFNSAFHKIYYTEIYDTIQNGDIWLLTEFPKEMSALSVVEDDIAYRFELYWKGVELVNAYFEERNEHKLKTFFEHSNKVREQDNKEVVIIDDEFLVKSAKLPSISGGSIGIDRLIYLLIKDKFSLKSLDEMLYHFFC